jgi:hypothetical protein
MPRLRHFGIAICPIQNLIATNKNSRYCGFVGFGLYFRLNGIIFADKDFSVRLFIIAGI